MDSDIENLMKSCSVCQELWPAPAAAPLHSWECPSQPWSRIHLDFAGPFWDTCFDTDLKWSDILITQSITAAKTRLRSYKSCLLIRRKELPIMEHSWISIVHAWEWHIVRITMAPYHPSRNGLPEWAVQNFKCGFKDTQGGLFKRDSQNVPHHAPYYCWAITCSVAQGSSLEVVASQTVSWYATT